ncbi:extracellular solute-binding protein [Cohnella sp. GCM10020058]|uniref:extracellular solute-binding protein n=1 Tax=Cohnella sp. GCM10020058 TaxID=3317330 RepID=UPI003643E198
MKQKAKNRLIPFVLIGSMLALSACSAGSKSNDNAAPSATAGSAASEAATSPAAKADPLGKYDPPITLTAAGDDQNGLKRVDGDTREMNNWTRGYENELGIKVSYKWVAEGGDISSSPFAQKMNITIASGDLPDLALVNSSQLKQLVDAGQIEDLSAVYDQYASDVTKQTMEQQNGIALNASSFDGKLYALPYTLGDIDNLMMLYVRMDWLKKLNLPEPKTTDDVLRIADAFAHQDPDGNGSADTFGFGLNKSLAAHFGIDGLANGYGAYPGIWVKDASNNVVYGSVQPEMKSVLGTLAEMYKAGSIDQEFGVKDFGKANEDLTAGKVGLFYSNMAGVFTMMDLMKSQPDAEWKPFAIPTADGQPGHPGVDFSTQSFYVVRKGYKHPEAAVKLLNFFTEKLYGASAATEKPKYQDDTSHYFQDAVIKAGSMDQNYKTLKAVNQALTNKDPSALDAGQKTIYENIVKYDGGDKSQWVWSMIFGLQDPTWGIDAYYLENNLYKPTEFFGGTTPTMTDKWGTLRKMELEEFTKIIMGAVPLDDFDRFVADWKKLGGDQITSEIADWKKSVQ